MTAARTIRCMGGLLTGGPFGRRFPAVQRVRDRQPRLPPGNVNPPRLRPGNELTAPVARLRFRPLRVRLEADRDHCRRLPPAVSRHFLVIVGTPVLTDAALLAHRLPPSADLTRLTLPNTGLTCQGTRVKPSRPGCGAAARRRLRGRPRADAGWRCRGCQWLDDVTRYYRLHRNTCNG